MAEHTPYIAAQIFIEPGQTEEETSTWFRLMAESGMQFCRIRIHESHVHIGDKWDFSLYDRAFDLAHGNGIRIFAALFPADKTNSVGGAKFPEDKQEQEKIAVFIRKVVTRYKKHPALDTWILQNEPGVCGLVPDTAFCQEYRTAWLQEHPKKAPTFDHWHTNDFSEEKMLSDMTTSYLRWISGVIREEDREHNLHVNNHQIFSNIAEYDFVKWREFLTTLGCSAHPSWHFGYFPRKRFAHAMLANCGIIRSGAGKLPFLVTELQGGNNIYSGTTPICPTKDEISQWTWASLFSGAEGVFYWTFNPRSATGEPGEWSMITFDDKASDRLEAAARIATVIKENKDLFKGAIHEESPVAVLFDRESLWVEKKSQFPDVDQIEGRTVGSVMKESLSIYKAFADNGLVPEFEEFSYYDWERENYEGKVIVLAHQIAIPTAYISRIERFVRLGGKLLVTGLTGFFDEDMVCRAKTGSALQEILGGRIKEVIHAADNSCELHLDHPAMTLPAAYFTSTISTSGAAAICQENGEVKATTYSYGNRGGNCCWIPSLIGIGADGNGSQNGQGDSHELSKMIRCLYGDLLDQQETGFSNICPDVILMQLHCGDRSLALLINKNETEQVVNLHSAKYKGMRIVEQTGHGQLFSGHYLNIGPEETILIKLS